MLGGNGGPGKPGGNGGYAYGGAVYVASGTVTLRNDTVTGNSAQGGAGGGGSQNGVAGLAKGGGLYIATAAIVSLDTFTLNHTTGNTPDNIYGSYTIIV